MTTPTLTDGTPRIAAQSGMKFPETQWERLPVAADYVGMAYFVANTPVGASLVVSDGVMWRIFARNVFTRRITLTTAMSGLVTFDYGTVRYTTLPTCIVTLSDPTKGGRLSYFVQDETLTGCKVRVSRGVLLPTLLTNLTGFDPFAGGSTNGVVVNLLALADS